MLVWIVSCEINVSPPPASKSPSLKYIDVWLVELRAASCEEAFTVRGLFALQLAAVVRSARGWQHLRLRLHAVSLPAPPPITIHGKLHAILSIALKKW